MFIAHRSNNFKWNLSLTLPQANSCQVLCYSNSSPRDSFSRVKTKLVSHSCVCEAKEGSCAGQALEISMCSLPDEFSCSPVLWESNDLQLAGSSAGRGWTWSQLVWEHRLTEILHPWKWGVGASLSQCTRYQQLTSNICLIAPQLLIW